MTIKYAFEVKTNRPSIQHFGNDGYNPLGLTVVSVDIAVRKLGFETSDDEPTPFFTALEGLTGIGGASVVSERHFLAVGMAVPHEEDGPGSKKKGVRIATGRVNSVIEEARQLVTTEQEDPPFDDHPYLCREARETLDKWQARREARHCLQTPDGQPMDYRGYFGPGQFLVSNTLWLPRNLIELTGFCDVDLWSPAKTKSFFCGVLNGRKPFKVN